MKRIFAFAILIMAFAACSKDKVESRPHLSFKSFSSKVIPVGSAARINLNFTDQEGDLDSIFVIRQRVNQRSFPNSQVIDLGIPKFANQNQGELQVALDYATQLTFNLNAIRIPGTNPSRYEPDTLQLRFYVKDKAKQTSDTLGPEQLIVLRQQ
jgi:hypothetical protein